jgi:hypothetical protein
LGVFVPVPCPPPRTASESDVSPRLIVIAVVASLAFVLTVGSALGVALALRHLKQLVDTQAARDERTEPASAPPSASTATMNDAPAEVHALPSETRTMRIGSVEVITLGSGAPELRAALREQVSQSRDVGRNLIVSVMDSDDCAPCRGVMSSLSAPELQDALRGARLVVLDRAAFKEELDALGLRADVQPMFLRFDESLRLLDAIHGGEWDDDVAVNIAPVLGAFARGTYSVRRYPAWTPARGVQRL